MILGFGNPDTEAKNQFKIQLGNYLKEKLGAEDFDLLDYFKVRDLLDDFSKTLPRHEFNGTKYGHGDNIFLEFSEQFGTILIICHGHYNRYNNNHPFSPDGFACLSIPYVLSVMVRKNPEQHHPKDSCLYQEKVQIFEE
jgi:hypothetical protein